MTAKFIGLMHIRDGQRPKASGISHSDMLMPYFGWIQPGKKDSTYRLPRNYALPTAVCPPMKGELCCLAAEFSTAI